MKWLSFTLMVATALNPFEHPAWAHQAQGDAFDPVLTEYSRHPDLVGFVEGLKGRMSEEMRSFLRSKAVELKNPQALRVTRVSPGVLRIDLGGGRGSLPLEAVSAGEGKFTLNHEALRLLPTDSPAKAWEKILACLPSQIAHRGSLWDFAVPPADAAVHALLIVSTVAALAGALVFGAINWEGCKSISDATEACAKGISRIADIRSTRFGTPTITSEHLEEVRSAIQKVEAAQASLWNKAVLGCVEEKRTLSECISAFKQKAVLLPSFAPTAAPAAAGAQRAR